MEPQPVESPKNVDSGIASLENTEPQHEKVDESPPKQVEETPLIVTPEGVGDGHSNDGNRFKSPSPTPVPPTEPASDPEPEEDQVQPPPQLSKGAADARLRRVMKPRADGSFIVPEVARDMYKDTSRRGSLMSLFEKCAFEPVPCLNLNLNGECLMLKNSIHLCPFS